MEDWEFTFAVNVLGVVRTLKTLVPVIEAQDRPAVVMTTASMAGITSGGGGLVSYFSSKHACVSLTESLHFELQRSEAGKKIAVHVLCPALVSSQLMTSSQDVRAEMEGDEDHEELAKGEDWGAATARARGSGDTAAQARTAKMLPMSREMREMLGDNEEALALYTREYGKANQKELWTPADFAKERVFEAVSTGKFYILVRPRAPPAFSAWLTRDSDCARATTARRLG